MNHVNLIGTVGTIPRLAKDGSGKQVARFILSTKEDYLDASGTLKARNFKHLISAWGRWIPIVVEYGKEGVEIAVEGRLTTRFYNSNGKINYITEVEVNDLIVM